MEKLNFSLQNIQDLANTDNFVVLQAGKGKRSNSSIYINGIEFSYLEGIIWDNYREYGMKLKTKISSHDFERIINGFQDGINDLSTYKSGDDLKSPLRFGIFNPKNPLKYIEEDTEEIKTLLTNIRTWASEWIQSEKHIFVIKNNL